VRLSHVFGEYLTQTALQHFGKAFLELLKLMAKRIRNLDRDLNRHRSTPPSNARIISHRCNGHCSIALLIQDAAGPRAAGWRYLLIGAPQWVQNCASRRTSPWQAPQT